MITTILLCALSAVISGLICHIVGYETGWDDGYETAVKWHTLREVRPE